MFRHVVVLVMLSILLPKSLQVGDELVLAKSKDGKNYLAKKRPTNISIDEDVGTDYSRLQGDFFPTRVYLIFVMTRTKTRGRNWEEMFR